MRRTFYTIENERFTGLKKRDISNRREIAFFGLRFFAFIPFCLKKGGLFPVLPQKRAVFAHLIQGT